MKSGDTASGNLWRRALAVVRGESPPSGLESLSETEARAQADAETARGNAELAALWTNIAYIVGAALATTPPPVVPEVAIAGGVDATEGEDATFTLTATPAPTSPLTVDVTVTEAGGYATSGARQVTIPAGGSATLSVATVDDAVDEPDGSVTVTVNDGAGYTVGGAGQCGHDGSVGQRCGGGAGALGGRRDGDGRRLGRDDGVRGPAVGTGGEAGAGAGVHPGVEPDVGAAEGGLLAAAVRSGDVLSGRDREGDVGVHLQDSHDEDPETFEVVLSAARGAAIEDGVAVGTIVNNDPMPAAWLARFGRTVAQQALDGIAGRLAAPRTLTLRDVLLGSSFTATGQPDAHGGSVAVWGRAAQATFEGREGAFALDGETTTAMLGTDYAQDRWLLGVTLLQSLGTGGYDDRDATPAETCANLPAALRAVLPAGRYEKGPARSRAP